MNFQCSNCRKPLTDYYPISFISKEQNLVAVCPTCFMKSDNKSTLSASHRFFQSTPSLEELFGTPAESYEYLLQFLPNEPSLDDMKYMKLNREVLDYYQKNIKRPQGNDKFQQFILTIYTKVPRWLVQGWVIMYNDLAHNL